MALRETVACIGLENKDPALIQRLAKADHRILLIRGNEGRLHPVFENVETAFPDSDMEWIPCAKEACWEADIVMLAGEAMADTAIIHKIKEVATQKIVACLFFHNDMPAGTQIQNLKKWLPYVKILELIFDSSGMEAMLSGNDTEALVTMRDLLQKCGFGIKQINRNRSLL